MARGGGGFGGGSGRGAAPEPRVAQGNFWAPPGLKAPPHRQRCRPSPERLDLRRPQDWNEAGERKESGGEHRITCSWGGGGVRKWAAPPTLCLYLGSSTSRTAVGAARRSREGVSSSRDLGWREQIKDPQDSPPKTPNHTRISPSPFQTPDPHSSESTEFPQFHSQVPPDHPPPPSETPVTPPPNYVSLPFPKSPPGAPLKPSPGSPVPPPPPSAPTPSCTPSFNPSSPLSAPHLQPTTMTPQRCSNPARTGGR